MTSAKDATGIETGVLDGVRVVEVADEQAEYAGMVLAGLGADVIKVEPPGGSPSRRIGPFLDDRPDTERSIHFWQHNRGKRSVVLDLTASDGAECLEALLSSSDILLHSRVPARDGDPLGLEPLAARHPALVVADMTPFGGTGPWASFAGSDLVHLALGGPAMNCGYDPRPDGSYDLAPIAPQSGHSYIITGEHLVIGLLAALVHRQRTGDGQRLSIAVHEAVAKSTELDLMNWVMRRAPLGRQTCRHAAERISATPTIAQTKDGRWMVTNPMGRRNEAQIVDFVARLGLRSDLDDGGSETGGRAIPGSATASERDARIAELIQRVVRKYTFRDLPWKEAQVAGVVCAPLRRPHENVGDEHWTARGTFASVEHPELGRSFDYPVRKWCSTAPDWVAGRRAPTIDEHGDAVRAEARRPASPAPTEPPGPAEATAAGSARLSARGTPFALDGVRVFDFGWFLASAGGTRFLASLGAEVIKVEWKGNPDTRMAAMAPVGGREARRRATGPLAGVTDSDMGGQFNNKNSGKRGLSLNVRHPEGLAIARRLIALSDVVAEGFSPGVLERWGLGYEALRQIKADIIYAQQSGMGSLGRYGAFRAVGPVAAALSGVSDMSGLPEPAMPAGWGYSYLDWIGAYSFASAILAALYYRDRTGSGQWIDASQTESGIFVSGEAILRWSADGRPFARSGNRAPLRPSCPHGIYPAAGADRWIAITCSSDGEWKALTSLLPGHWVASGRFATQEDRLAHEDELDALIAGWTADQDAYGLMAALQRAGVPAGVCQTAADRCDADPQLRHLEWLTEVTGTKIGRWPVAEMPVKMSLTPAHAGGPVDRGAPCYGEDNEWVLGELLGMGAKEIDRLREDGVV